MKIGDTVRFVGCEYAGNDELNCDINLYHFISYHSLSYNPHGNKNVEYKKKKLG